MLEFIIALVVLVNIFFYGLGVKMANSLRENNVPEYQKYGSPKFYLYGISEYRLMFLFILFGDYKRKNLDKSSLRLLNAYRYTFMSNIILLIVFLMFMVSLN